MRPVSRRQLLAGVGGMTLTGVSAWIAFGPTDTDSSAQFPITVETIRSQGSTAGTIELPITGAVTVVDLFATWCGPCSKQMPVLRSVNESSGDDVRMVSVTNERTGSTLSVGDIRAWWADHEGDWTVGHDPDSTLMTALQAGRLPYVVVFAPDGSVVFQHSGVVGEQTLLDAIAEARP